jgi:hypothetical protein
VLTVIEGLYALTTIIFIASGLSMAGMGLRAYVETAQASMLHLSTGFSLAAAGAAATMISAFLYGFDNPRWLLLVQTALITIGMLFVMYSIVAYDQ